MADAMPVYREVENFPAALDAQEAEATIAINREELRLHLTRRMALAWVGVGGGIALLSLPGPALRLPAFILGVLLLALALGVLTVNGRYPIPARHLLLWSPYLALLAAAVMLAQPWVPFLGLILLFTNAFLVANGELATAAAIAVAAAAATYFGVRAYPLWTLASALIVSAILARVTVHALYTALLWARNRQQEADRLLKLSRQYQGELSRTLKSLDLAYALQQRTQHELIQARRQVEESASMKQQFAANISHELRTPLNLILGFSEMMYLHSEVYGELDWPAALRRDIYQIYSSSRHLLDMVDDVLDLSKYEVVGFTLHKEATPLSPFLEETISIIQSLFRDPAVRLESAIAADLPALEIDRTRIRQAALNLLNNAQRFTQAGTVCLAASEVRGELVIRVLDTGQGIPAAKLPYIFGEFYQVDLSLNRSHQGVGLGLAICKRFVEAHGGRVWVESQEGLGSTFSIGLPIPGQSLPLSYLSASPKVAQIPSTVRPRVLVVDADPSVTAVVQRHLPDYETLQVENAQALERAVALHSPRVVIHNVMPHTAPAAPARLPDLPVAAIACSLPSRTWIASMLSVAACLTKPVTAQQLLDELERLRVQHQPLRNVLIVDDNWGFVQLVERILEASRQSFSIRRALDGDLALTAMRASRPDVVLLDLIMPNVDGFRVLEEMRRDPALAAIPVIVLTVTSYADDALAHRGSDLLISQPGGLSPAEVLACLHSLVPTLKPRYEPVASPGDR